MVGGYAWKMNGNECGVTYFTLHTPRNLRHQVPCLKIKKPPPSYLRLYGGHKSGQRLVGDGRKRDGQIKYGLQHLFTTTNDHT